MTSSLALGTAEFLRAGVASEVAVTLLFITVLIAKDLLGHQAAQVNRALTASAWPLGITFAAIVASRLLG